MSCPAKTDAVSVTKGIPIVTAAKVTALKPYRAKKIQIFYIFHCILKGLLEVLFIYLGYHLQFLQSRKKPFLECFTVPEKYLCKHAQEKEFINRPDLTPCAQQQEISCWVSRPQEKEYFVQYT